jgi:hypothetical protein
VDIFQLLEDLLYKAYHWHYISELKM